MPTVKATPPAGAITRKEAQAQGLAEFLSMSICRKAGCDTFVREARSPWRCVACRDREAPKVAAQAEKARELAQARAAKARKAAAAERKRQEARDLKEAAKAAARKARQEARELASRQAAAKKAAATRAANKAQAKAQELAQKYAQALIGQALDIPPWEDLPQAPEAAPLVDDEEALHEADEWADEGAMPW